MRNLLIHSSIFEEELEHIPEGSNSQNLFRLMYRVHRMHSLYEDTPLDARRRALMESCCEVVREFYPRFKPTCDEKYFGVILED